MIELIFIPVLLTTDSMRREIQWKYKSGFSQGQKCCCVNVHCTTMYNSILMGYVSSAF